MSNKKLFISSRYLKDAVIDVNDKITSISSEIGGLFVGQLYPVRLGGSLDFTTAGSALLDNNISYGVVDSFFIGHWLNPSSYEGYPSSIRLSHRTKDDQFIFYADAAGGTWEAHFRETGGAVTSLNGYPRWTNSWKYLAAILKNNEVYFLVDGVIVAKEAFPYQIDLSNCYLIIGSTELTRYGVKGYYDDILISIGDSIIDPINKVVGNKVFEPPRRKSLDSEFIQY